ncbi:MAG TPA: hypothetical protein VGN64_16300 [Dyadobacter sp.]|jgi:hypothetical protein|nr:hypothetical protein [Dyadobacter sp.]
MIFDKRKGLLVFVLVLFVSGCRENSAGESISDYDYFPVQSGSVAQYAVTKTIYTPTDSPQTSSFRIRSVIGDRFDITNQEKAYRVSYSSKTEHTDWHADSAGAVWLTSGNAFALENGKTIVKMYFPLSDGMYWNGNSFNDEGEKTFYCIDKGKPKQVGSHYFPNTVTIIRQQDSTLLSKNKYIEIYAAGIGLVATEKMEIKYCYTPGCAGTIVSGHEEKAVIQELNTL